jgi:hypothetical protein
MSDSDHLGSHTNRNAKKKKLQMWPQKFEGKREDIYYKCSNNENFVKKMTAVLNEEERVNMSNKNYLDNFRGGDKEKNNGVGSILPEKVQKNINETRRLNNELKKQVDEISKMNALYIMKQGGKYIEVESRKKDNNYIELPSITSNLSKVELPKNFRYINDSYRNQLMRAFLNFNPTIHLNNLRNLLEKADPAIKEYSSFLFLETFKIYGRLLKKT